MLKDPNGRAIVVGCRVSVRPRRLDNPFEVVPPDDEETPSVPRVSGRVIKIYEGKQGTYVDVRCSHTLATRTVPASLCKVQPGKTTQEKRLSQAIDKKRRKK